MKTKEIAGYVSNGAEFIILSDKGKNWNGKKLNENNLLAGQLILWRNKFYTTGNRYHELVELYNNKEVMRIVNINSIRLCREKEDPIRDVKLREILKRVNNI